MTMYVYITDRCEKDAQTHALAGLVSNVQRQIENTQSLTGFRFFSSTSFMLKPLGRSFRLVAYRKSFESSDLILFLRVLARGEKEYKIFLSKSECASKELEQKFLPYSSEELFEIYQRVSSQPAVSPPPELNDSERLWLYGVFGSRTPMDDLVVLETNEWVKRVQAPEMREFLASYHRVVEHMITRIYENKLKHAHSNKECQIFWDEGDRLGIAYLYRPDLKRILLLEPVRDGMDLEGLLKEYIGRLEKLKDTAEDLSRVAGRSYPWLMVLDRDLWLAIERDDKANLALSPEESNLLESLRAQRADAYWGFPLFINGRAGSGKTTILQYLAADFVEFALIHRTELQPIYMTCSRELLLEAREAVRKLLTVHHERLLKRPLDKKMLEQMLERCFVVFHEFLRSLLDPKVLGRFRPERYVNYVVFRRLWEDSFRRRPEAQHMSPDIAWHTIRSFIKGIRSSPDDDLDPTEFAALPRRRKSVSLDVYEEIYDRVWLSWYRRLCEEEDYWDDQDLAATVLASGILENKSYAAIFCDEAQDFTPLEIEIVYRLSVYAKRSLRPEELRRIPIVFAGDPLQTINPTGFRWDAVKATFHDHLCSILDPRRRASPDISYKELQLNYRSNPGIVRFCNLIQLIRAACLDRQDVSPQEPWWVDHPVQTLWYDVDSANTKDSLLRCTDFVKIVNCEADEETDYVRSDEILVNLKEQSEGIYRNVVSVNRAKGLEFPAVVLFRFGDSAPKDIDRLISGDLDTGGETDKLLPFEYFLNRVYVAASRAKKQLIVVDSREGFQRFWSFATNPTEVERLIAKTRNPSAWKNAVSFLVEGREEPWTTDRIDPIEQAEEYAAQGRRNRDPYLMRQAALAYRNGNRNFEADRCLALAAEFEQKLAEAGDRYLALGLLKDAFRCYWDGQQFEKVVELANKNPGYASRLESRAADFVARTKDVPLAFLEEIIRATSTAEWLEMVARDKTWRYVIGQLAARLANIPRDHSIPWKETLHVMKLFAGHSVLVEPQYLAAIAFAAEDYAYAIEMWERARMVNHEQYWWAKTKVEKFPEVILWLARLHQSQEILQQWFAHRSTVRALESLPIAVVDAIVDSAIELGDLNVACQLLEVRPNKERIAALLAAAAERNDTDLLFRAAKVAIKMLIMTSAWRELVDAVEKGDFGDLTKHLHDAVDTRLFTNKVQLLRVAIEELARSPELAQAGRKDTEPIKELLRRWFVSGKARKPTLVRPQVVGAAIERTGWSNVAVDYYYKIYRDRESSPELKRFAAGRLIVNIERLINYHMQENKASDKRKVEEYRRLADTIREAMGFGKDERFPEFPELPVARELETPTEQLIGPFRFVVSRAHRRLLIVNLHRCESVTVHAAEKQLKGEVVSEVVSPSQNAVASWGIREWKMRVDLFSGPTSVRISCTFDGGSFEVEL